MIGIATRRSVSLALTAGACALLIWLVRRMGPGVILEQCLVLGGVLPVVLVLTFFKYPLQAAGWRLALPAAMRPPWWPSVRATLAGDAMGYLTLAGPITGEPLRATLLRSYISISTGIAVGAVERTLYAIGGAVIVVVAFLVAGAHIGHAAWTAIVPTGLLMLGAAGAWAFARERRHAARRATAHRWRGVLHQLCRERRLAVVAIALLCLAQHAILITEAYVMLDALGVEPTVATALVFEGVTKTINTVGAIVPGRLGVAEGGSAAMAQALGIGASFGLSLALMRRVRALLWGVAGIGLMLPDLSRMYRLSLDRTATTAVESPAPLCDPPVPQRAAGDGPAALRRR